MSVDPPTVVPTPLEPPKRSLARGLFGWWKWPGYGTLGLSGVLRLFHIGEDIDFVLGALRSLGGSLELVAAVIASPFFALTLAVYGVIHLIFVGEPRQAVRHRGWVYLGWGVFTVCFVTLVGTIGYGAIQLSIKSEVGKEDEKIQRRSAQRPVFWHLTDIQKLELGVVLDKTPEKERFAISVMCLPDAGTRTYAEDIAKLFLDRKWNLTANCLFNNLRPDFIGLAIGVSSEVLPEQGLDLSKVPGNAKKLAKILEDAHIAFTWGRDTSKGISKDDFYLIVGNPP